MASRKAAENNEHNYPPYIFTACRKNRKKLVDIGEDIHNLSIKPYAQVQFF